MMDAMRKAGCAVDRRFFKVEACAGNVVGGFRPPDGVRAPPPRGPARALTPRCRRW